MDAHGPFPWLSRWNRRATIVFVVLLFLMWLGFAALGIWFPVEIRSSLLILLLLQFGCMIVLSLVWLTILISPGMPRRGNPLRQTAWRLGAAGLCALLAAAGVFAGGGPLDLGTRMGGMLGIGLQPFRDLQNLPAVSQLALESSGGELDPEKWPGTLRHSSAAPRYIHVGKGPPGPPSLYLAYGRGAYDVVMQTARPPDDDADVIPWADGIWLKRMYGE